MGVMIAVSSASSNPYDDCILQYMGGAQTQMAVYAIERSCINKTAVLIPEAEIGLISSSVVAYAGLYNMGYGRSEPGLTIRIINATSFDLVEVRVLITNKKTGQARIQPVTQFNASLSPGAFYSGVGEPALVSVIKQRASREFVVPIPEVSSVSAEFSKNYSWDIFAVRGVPTN